MSEPTIEDLLRMFMDWMRSDVADGNASSATLHSYFGDVRDHLEWLGKQNLKPVQADEDILQEYRSHLIATYKLSTAGRKFTAVRRFYDMASRHGQLPSNPAARLKSPVNRTSEDAENKYISRPAMQKMLVLSDEQHQREAHAKVKALRDQAMLLLTMRHGLRESELAQANVEDLTLQSDGETSTLRVWGKGPKGRIIHLVPQTQIAIEKWLGAHRMLHVASDGGDGVSQPGVPLFISLHWGGRARDHRRKRMGTRGIRAMIDGYLTAAGAKATGISGHALRHSFGIWSLFDGADVRAVRQELGHSSSETTTKYSKAVAALKRHPAEYLEFLEAAAPEDVAQQLPKMPKSRRVSRRRTNKKIRQARRGSSCSSVPAGTSNPRPHSSHRKIRRAQALSLRVHPSLTGGPDV